MYLDRPSIKAQAKMVIKNRVFNLFLVTLIVVLLQSGISGAISTFTNQDNSLFGSGFSDYFKGRNNYGYDDDNDFYDFGQDEDDGEDEYEDSDGDSDAENDFKNFGGNLTLTSSKSQKADIEGNTALHNSLDLVGTAASIIFGALAVALAGFYVQLIRGNSLNLGGSIKFVFYNAFKRNFGKKIAVSLLRTIFTALLSLLLIFPGIIFHYSSAFAYELICDYPDLSPMEAINLSRKIVRGNRTELFVLDLSFIPWGLLCIFVFPIIYVWPYYFTVHALYYENFRLRALSTGRVNDFDFLSNAQKFQYKFGVQDGTTPGDFQNPESYTQNPNGNYYNPPFNQDGGYSGQQNAQNVTYEQKKPEGAAKSGDYSDIIDKAGTKAQDVSFSEVPQQAPSADFAKSVEPTEAFNEMKSPEEPDYIEPTEPENPVAEFTTQDIPSPIPQNLQNEIDKKVDGDAGGSSNSSDNSDDDEQL